MFVAELGTKKNNEGPPETEVYGCEIRTSHVVYGFIVHDCEIRISPEMYGCITRIYPEMNGCTGAIYEFLMWCTDILSWVYRS